MKRNVPDYVQKLLMHAFTRCVFEDCRSVYLATGVPGKVLNAELTREPDEYEFYILRAGNRITHLLETCRQLSDAILYLASFSPSERMKKAGITRHSHLLYTIENFIIRTSTLYDRALKLVDAVFHLCNDPKECRHNTILKNAHVERTLVPDRMQALRKVVNKYLQDRNSIIHHETYQDNRLRILEMYVLLQRELTLAGATPSDELQHLPELTKDMVYEIVWVKTREFEEFNTEMFSRVVDLLSELDSEYLRQKRRLLRLCGHGEHYAPTG
jgi:septum formation topological specificity factor MinE